MAPAAARVPALEDHPPLLLQDLEARRYLGEDARRPTQARAGAHENRDPESSAGVVDTQSLKTTGVGGGGRGYDGAKKVKGRKAPPPSGHSGVGARSVRAQREHPRPRRHQAPAREPARTCLTRLSHLWMDAGYTGQDKGVGWVQSVLGWTAQKIVRHPPKPVPEAVMMRWAREWAKEGVSMDPKKLLPPEGPRAFLPRRWVVERTFSWLGQNRRMSKDYERVCRRAQKRSSMWR
jgi:putative transposase